MKAKLILPLLLSFCLGSTSHAVPAKGHKIMISAATPAAVEAGRRVAAKGGNVVDVAVAVGLALAVTAPYYAGLGGGGFALIQMGKGVEVVDFRETAPKATHPDFYKDKAKDASINGGAAVGVPGWPAGLWAMHKKYGKLHWSRLFDYPIRLATKGFNVSGDWADIVKKSTGKFNAGGKKHFLKRGKTAYKAGELFKQPSLGRVLKEMSNRNITSFYRGRVARDIVRSVKEAGGVLTLEDLRNYKVRWLKPMTTHFKGHKLYLMPPPSSGGLVLKSALNLIDRIKLPKQKMYSVDEFHLMGEVLSRSFRGRALLGDPDFHKNPIDHLLSNKYLKEMAKSIDDDETEKLEALNDLGPKKESTETTHYSVLDANGNAVSLTITLNGYFGSKVVSNKFGIALNNEMDDFTTRPGEPNMFGLVQGSGNYVQPGKRPLSSMSPTLVEKKGKVVMALGGQGGPRIISGVLNVIYRTLVSQLDMDEAIQAPRVHHQFLPHKLFIDERRFFPETVEALQKKDHVVEPSWMGKIYAVKINNDGDLEAAHDSRREGASGGY